MGSPIAKGTITTPFGKSGSKWKSGSQEGVDHAVPISTEELVPTDGIIVETGNVWRQSFGFHQVLMKSGNYYCLFAHM
jgi:hypothetical protein